jgi:hypothetical protein
MFRHDKCIVKQYLLTKKAWTLPTGETQLVPKEEGQGVMISAFQSREFGFGMPLTEEQIQTVNEFRKGKKYKDEEAAAKYLGSILKKDLTCSPFIIEFEYGAGNEGYWNFERMVLQLENCVDVVRCLYPQYDYLFLFDHSCRYDKQQPNGLNAENMSKLYGGKQSYLHDLTIQQEQGYLGNYSRTLMPGDIQKMMFQPADDGPFFLTTKQQEGRREDSS